MVVTQAASDVAPDLPDLLSCAGSESAYPQPRSMARWRERIEEARLARRSRFVLSFSSLRFWESRFPQMGKGDGGFTGLSSLNDVIGSLSLIIVNGTTIEGKPHSM
jgi:hypothetical protein